jgi:hypothetical protein
VVVEQFAILKKIPGFTRCPASSLLGVGVGRRHAPSKALGCMHEVEPPSLLTAVDFTHHQPLCSVTVTMGAPNWQTSLPLVRYIPAPTDQPDSLCALVPVHHLLIKPYTLHTSQNSSQTTHPSAVITSLDTFTFYECFMRAP